MYQGFNLYLQVPDGKAAVPKKRGWRASAF
jgi:hypothetical protein